MEKYNWKRKNVLITGAGGFIGSHLTEKLVNLGSNVRALVHYNSLGKRGWLDALNLGKEIEVIAGDVCDRDSVRKATKGQDVVFHLAALIGIPYSYEAISSYVQTNIVGTFNVLQSSLENNVQCLIHTSTSEAYGTAQYVPIDENHPLQAQSPYSATKIGADKLAESFYRSFNLPLVIIRPFNTFGPRQSARAIIPTIISQISKQKKIIIGATEPKRDFLFVEDTAAGFIAAAESGKKALGEVFNIGSGQEISIKDLANLIIELSGKKAKVISSSDRRRPNKSEVDRLLSDTAKARNILNWKPKFTLQEGLKKTIEWFLKPENSRIYKHDRYNI